jgi:Undecaprenyl-phosphate glucose phosphotransferase
LLRRQSHLFHCLAVVFDVAATCATWLLCYVVRFRLGLLSYHESAPPPAADFAEVLPIVVACNLLALVIGGLYKPAGRGYPFAEGMRIVRSALIAWLALLAGLYYYSRNPYSRVLLFIFLFANPLGLMASRALLRLTLRSLRHQGWGVKRAAIVGTGRCGQEVLHKLSQNPWLGIQVSYFVQHDDQPDRSEIRGVPVLSGISSLQECVRDHPVDAVFVALPSQRSDRLDDVLGALSRLPVSVAVVPDFKRTFALAASVGELGGLPMIQLRGSPITGWNAAAKRSIDLVGSAVLLIVLGFPMLLLAALVRLTSRGPVIFKQERMGLGGRRFTMQKFRSMRADAEQETGPVVGEVADPRCTGLGRLMRRLGLDELPQLVNVLRGDMSLVGPRPERPHFVEQFAQGVPAYMLRHDVKAGLTGWAQINGLRGQCSLRKRLQYDLYYINNWSLGFDLFILAATPLACFIRRRKR